MSTYAVVIGARISVADLTRLIGRPEEKSDVACARFKKDTALLLYGLSVFWIQDMCYIGRLDQKFDDKSSLPIPFDATDIADVTVSLRYARKHDLLNTVLGNHAASSVRGWILRM